MHRNEYLRLIAGVMVVTALMLDALVHPNWNYLAVLVAVNFIQSTLTGWRPMMALMRRLGVQE